MKEHNWTNSFTYPSKLNPDVLIIERICMDCGEFSTRTEFPNGIVRDRFPFDVTPTNCGIILAAQMSRRIKCQK